MRALHAEGYEIDAIGGCSQGAMVATLVACEAGWPGAGLGADDALLPLAATEATLRRFSAELCSPFKVVRDMNWFRRLSTFSGGGFARAVEAQAQPRKARVGSSKRRSQKKTRKSGV